MHDCRSRIYAAGAALKNQEWKTRINFLACTTLLRDPKRHTCLMRNEDYNVLDLHQGK